MLDRVIIRCILKEDAKELMKVLNDLGCKWFGGGIPSSKNTNWNYYKEDTIYILECNKIGLGRFDKLTIKFYKDWKWWDSYRFINEYKKDNIMTKEDLKAGMLIEIENGERAIITYNSDDELVASGETWFSICDLKYNLIDNTEEYTKITKVYGRSNSNKCCCKLTAEYRELLWERKEPKEYTMQEIADKMGIPVEELRIKK